MIFFIALISATALTIAGYFVLYLSTVRKALSRSLEGTSASGRSRWQGWSSWGRYSLQLTVAAMAPCTGCTAGCTGPGRVIHGSLDLAKMSPRPLHSPRRVLRIPQLRRVPHPLCRVSEVRRCADDGFRLFRSRSPDDDPQGPSRSTWSRVRGIGPAKQMTPAQAACRRKADVDRGRLKSQSGPLVERRSQHLGIQRDD